MKALVFAVSALALLSSAAVAGEVVHQKSVAYSDLNLGSQDGVTALHNRILAAAKEVCATDAEKAAGNTQNREYSYCRSKAMHNAIAQVSEKIAYRLSSVQ